MRRNQLF